MRNLWITAARIVRKASAARDAFFDPQSCTRRPQLLPAGRAPQAAQRKGFFVLPAQLSLFY